MAPKAENKQGRFILRVVIIFLFQIAELSICSIMRVRTFCGDNSQKTTILYRSHTESDQLHVLERRTRLVSSLMHLCRLFCRLPYDSSKTQFLSMEVPFGF